MYAGQASYGFRSENGGIIIITHGTYGTNIYLNARAWHGRLRAFSNYKLRKIN